MKMNITFNGETKVVDFTKVQAEVVKRLLSGEKVAWIHTNRLDGGDLVWYKDGYFGWGTEKVGYKAYTNALSKICKAFGYRPTDKEYKQIFSQYEVELG